MSREPSKAKTAASRPKHGRRDSQSAASRSRSAGRREDRWPFKRGRVIPCRCGMICTDNSLILQHLSYASDEHSSADRLVTLHRMT